MTNELDKYNNLNPQSLYDEYEIRYNKATKKNRNFELYIQVLKDKKLTIDLVK